jgi:hypothetical protein
LLLVAVVLVEEDTAAEAVLVVIDLMLVAKVLAAVLVQKAL